VASEQKLDSAQICGTLLTWPADLHLVNSTAMTFDMACWTLRSAPGMMRDALAAGEIDTGRLQTATPAPLRQQLARWRETTGKMAGLPDGALVACLIGYAQLHGVITLELVGRIPPQLQPSALFDLQMAHVSGSLNAPPPPW
jgi:hypothetical protein